MQLLSIAKSYLNLLFRRRQIDADLDAEIRSAVEWLADQKIKEGMPADAARRAARMELGGVEQVKEAVRSGRAAAWLDTLVQDVRFALRMLRKSRGFTVVAVLTLALGIGANTAIFSAVNGLLLEPLPYAHPSRLVKITSLKEFPARGVVAEMSLSGNLWARIFTGPTSFEQTAFYSPSKYTILTAIGPERVSGSAVSGTFFSVLGTKPLLGRPILDSDTRPAQSRVVVLGFALWRDLFGGDVKIVGREITLDSEPYRVVGVMPPEVEFGAGARGLWIPASADSSIGRSAVARLKPGSKIGQADAQLQVGAERVIAKYPKLSLKGWSLSADQVTRNTDKIGGTLFILLGAVGFVLLIACVNVSALIMARGRTRQREIAIREALGATRLRLVRQFLAESVTLSIAGGSVGLVLSLWGIRVLRAIVPPGTPHTELVRMDPAVLSFTAGISILTGLLFGLAPALRASAQQVGAALKGASDALADGDSRRPRRTRNALVAVEIALALVLVIGATLAARSLENMLNVNLGFRTDHILTIFVHFSQSVCNSNDEASATQCHLAVAATLDRVRSLPGVLNAAAVSDIPLSGGSAALSLQIAGRPEQLGIEHGSFVYFRAVTPGYFRALRVPLLVGQDFDTKPAQGARVAIVNEAFARDFLGGHPLGRRISMGKDKSGKPEWMRVIGEVQSGDDVSLGSEDVKRAPAEFYLPFSEADYWTDFYSGGKFIVRTGEDPTRMTHAVERRIWSVDKNAPITDVRTVDQIVANNAAESRFQTLLLGAFGGLGLLLAVVGTYGVISYSVAQRTHEIGVRMALGAQPGTVLRMVIGEGMVVAGIGIAIGIAAALGLTRFLRSLLFQVKATDPATFVSVAIALALVAVAACYIPARRAMRVDPMSALRHE